MGGAWVNAVYGKIFGCGNVGNKKTKIGTKFFTDLLSMRSHLHGVVLVAHPFSDGDGMLHRHGGVVRFIVRTNWMIHTLHIHFR